MLSNRVNNVKFDKDTIEYKMGFGHLKVKCKAKSDRGTTDVAAVEDAVKESWVALKDALDTLSTEEEQEMKDHFNNLIKDDDMEDLGDILFGDLSDFEERMYMLSFEEKTTYFTELI